MANRLVHKSAFDPKTNALKLTKRQSVTSFQGSLHSSKTGWDLYWFNAEFLFFKAVFEAVDNC